MMRLSYKKLLTTTLLTTTHTLALSSTSMTSSTSTTAIIKPFTEVSTNYNSLVSKLQTITHLRRAQAVLDYDRTVFMPQSEESAAERGQQLAALAGIVHEKSTSSEIKELIEASLKDLAQLNDDDDYKDEKRHLDLAFKSFVNQECLSPELVARKTKLSNQAYGEWAKAREASDFKAFEPYLKDCYDVAMEVATAQRAVAQNTDIPLYTQMLDSFETGMDVARINEIFDTIQCALVPLITRVLSSSTPPSTDVLRGTFDIDKQKKLNKKIVSAIGFDEKFGRIDVSVHPFTTSFSPKDVRITSRFREDEWYQGLAGSVHEAGHAMYEQNLGDSGLAIDDALSMGVHESQSLFWERHVGLSRPFWKWATPLLKESLENCFDEYSPEDVYKAVNAVSPSFIRVEADELTYPLHVILRFKIEKDVIEGNLKVQDIPTRWNQEMKSLLDVDVTDDSKGCLQDVHWSMLAFGYFPTYLLGAACAAQLSYYCHKDIPDMDEKIANGEFSEIKAWLTSKVHKHGSRYKSLDDLFQAQLGEKLNPQYFIDYLTEKYTDIYGC